MAKMSLSVIVERMFWMVELASKTLSITLNLIKLLKSILKSSGRGGTADGDTIRNVEGVVGSAFDDTLVGDNAANLLVGNQGDDQIAGGAGDDLLVGGQGNDQLAAAMATMWRHSLVT